MSFTNQLDYSGGTQCAKRNLDALQDIVGKENVDVFLLHPREGGKNLSSLLTRFGDILRCYMGALTHKTRQEILQKIQENHYTDLFIDSSLLGILSKNVKKRFPDIHIMTFFHNMEYDFMNSNIKDGKDYLHAFWIPLAKYNEVCACKYSDSIIVLNNHDAQRIEELYHRKADSVIPITMNNDYQGISQEKETAISKKKNALFVGSYFFGNITGLTWFCDKILPHTQIHLTVVGAGMDAFKQKVEGNQQISVFSNVPDLTPYYEEADFVILPITAGGGMKVKTAEALKYGKYIIGTREALAGYQVDQETATVCSSEKDFIEAIQHFDRPYRYNAASRALFLSHYSYSNSLTLFKKVILS